jgi:hypothetical protein
MRKNVGKEKQKSTCFGIFYKNRLCLKIILKWERRFKTGFKVANGKVLLNNIELSLLSV